MKKLLISLAISLSLNSSSWASATQTYIYRHNGSNVKAAVQPEEPEDTAIRRTLSACGGGVQLMNLFSAEEWTGEFEKIVTVPTGAICGNINAARYNNPSISLGPMIFDGSLTLTVDGEVQGAGGIGGDPSRSMSGGTAILLNGAGRKGQKINIVVNGAVRAGGGAGGWGAKAGTILYPDNKNVFGGDGGSGGNGQGYLQSSEDGEEGGPWYPVPEFPERTGVNGYKGGAGGGWGEAGQKGVDAVDGSGYGMPGANGGTAIFGAGNANITNNGVIQGAID